MPLGHLHVFLEKCLFRSFVHLEGASLIDQLIKNLPAMQKTLVWFLGQEDPLEKGKGYPLQYSWASLVAQLVNNLPGKEESTGKESGKECGRPGFDPWVGKIPWRREKLPTPVFWPGEFLIGFFVLMWLSIMTCLQILETNPLLITTSANIFSQSLGCLFILLIASFDM